MKHYESEAPSSAPRSRDAWMRGVTDSTRVRQLWLGDDGVIRVECWPGVEHTRADAEETLASIRALAGPPRRFALVDLRRCKAVDPGAEAVYAGPRAAGLLTATALMASSSLLCAVSNFLMAPSKAMVPTRWFSSKREALVWLASF